MTTATAAESARTAGRPLAGWLCAAGGGRGQMLKPHGIHHVSNNTEYVAAPACEQRSFRDRQRPQA